MRKSHDSNNSAKLGELLTANGHKGKRLDKDVIYRVFLGAALILGITFLYPIEKIYLPLEVPNINEIAAEDVRAPFDFPIFKSPEELEQDRQLVLANLRPVLSFDTLLTQMVTDRVGGFFALIDSIRADTLSRSRINAILQSRYPVLSDSTITALLAQQIRQIGARDQQYQSGGAEKESIKRPDSRNIAVA